MREIRADTDAAFLARAQAAADEWAANNLVAVHGFPMSGDAIAHWDEVREPDGTVVERTEWVEILDWRGNTIGRVEIESHE